MDSKHKSLRKKFNEDYFARYREKAFLGKQRGERTFFYTYWMKYLSRNFSNGAKILEVGCGLGYFLKVLSTSYQTYALDISFEALGDAKSNVKNGLVFQADAQELPLRNASLDCVLAFDLIEHLTSPETFLEQVKRILKRNGLLIIGTPNPESIGCVMKRKKDDSQYAPWQERMQEWHGWRDETHINIRKIEEWRELLGAMGFQLIRDGTDFLWDTPYFPYVPLFLQKLVFNGSHRLLTSLFGFLPWKRGENYYVVAQNRI